MRKILGVVFCLAAMVRSQQVCAWGEPGHQLIGDIAWTILNSENKSAAAKIATLLGNGVSLSLATTWADCAKSVNEETFQYSKGEFTPAICSSFSTADRALMETYVRDNLAHSGPCNTKPGLETCPKQYHYADVSEDHARYVSGQNPEWFGVDDHDVVHSINAAMHAIQKKQWPYIDGAYVIENERVALFMLAHFVGDIHQPLHVGAVYLDAQGNRLDPDTLGQNPWDAGTATSGGNNITGIPPELHGSWDTIPANFSTTLKPGMETAAGKLAKSSGDASSWATRWASDSVELSHSTAFAPLTFTAKSGETWGIDPASLTGYDKEKGGAQETQIVAAGRHLADMLEMLYGS